MKSNNILKAWRLLYVTYGLFPIIVGIDKYSNFFADWSIYFSPVIPQFFNMPTTTFMHIFAALQILIGLLVFCRPIIGSYAITLLLIIITTSLISSGSYTPEGYAHAITHYDTALYALVMTIGSYVFILLSHKVYR